MNKISFFQLVFGFSTNDTSWHLATSHFVPFNENTFWDLPTFKGNWNHEERDKRDLVFSVFFAVAISSPFEAAVVARMACSPLFWAGGCGRILITLVRPEPAEKSTLKGHGKRLLALVAPVD